MTLTRPIPSAAHPGVREGWLRRVFGSHLTSIADLSAVGAAPAVAAATGWPDISEFNDPPYRSTPINWDVFEQQYQNGQILGVGMRAGFGTVRADHSFARNQSEARKRGIPSIPYWFCYPAYNTPQAEAAMFNSVVGPLGPAEAMMADFENDPGAIGWPSPPASLNWATAFLNAMQSPQNATWWYCSRSFVAPFGLAPLADTWPWVIAEYGVSAPDGLGLNPMGWQASSTATVPGVDGPCDYNFILRPPFTAWLTPGAVDPVPDLVVSGGGGMLAAGATNQEPLWEAQVGKDRDVYLGWFQGGVGEMTTYNGPLTNLGRPSGDVVGTALPVMASVTQSTHVAGYIRANVEAVLDDGSRWTFVWGNEPGNTNWVIQGWTASAVPTNFPGVYIYTGPKGDPGTPGTPGAPGAPDPNHTHTFTSSGTTSKPVPGPAGP